MAAKRPSNYKKYPRKVLLPNSITVSQLLVQNGAVLQTINLVRAWPSRHLYIGLQEDSFDNDAHSQGLTFQNSTIHFNTQIINGNNVASESCQIWDF